MWSYLYAEPAVPQRDVLAEIEAGEVDERWLVQEAQEREGSLGARLSRALRTAAADLWPRLAGLAARGRRSSTWQGARV